MANTATETEVVRLTVSRYSDGTFGVEAETPRSDVEGMAQETWAYAARATGVPAGKLGAVLLDLADKHGNLA